MTRYLILGAGIAGTIAAREILRNDPASGVSLVSREDPPLMNRPALPYILTGSLPESSAFWDLDADVDRSRLELLFGRTVKSIDTGNRRLVLLDGETPGYDKLLIASGASPSAPPVPGIDSDGVFGFNTLADLANIRKFMTRGSSSAGCVILGGGFIGITAAAAFRKLGVAVSVIEAEDTILPAMLDADAGKLAADLLASTGASIHTGVKAAEVVSGRDGAVRRVSLETGKTIEAGIVIAATGVKPDLTMFGEAGIRVGGGILVDGRLAAETPGVWAAGDACETVDSATGERKYIPNRINAVNQGRIAGINMAGGDERYDGGFALNSLVISGVPVMSFGVQGAAGAGCSVETAYYGGTGAFRRVSTRDGRIAGAAFIGDPARAGTLARLARDGVDISGFEHELVEDSPGLMSLLLEMRREKMEGPVEWPAVFGMKEKYKKKIDVDSWKKRGRKS